jgi:hypothetical protein
MDFLQKYCLECFKTPFTKKRPKNALKNKSRPHPPVADIAVVRVGPGGGVLRFLFCGPSGGWPWPWHTSRGPAFADHSDSDLPRRIRGVGREPAASLSLPRGGPGGTSPCKGFSALRDELAPFGGRRGAAKTKVDGPPRTFTKA